MPEPLYSLCNEDFDDDPYPVFAQLRETAPVCRVEGAGNATEWLVTRYDDVSRLLNDKDSVVKDQRSVYPQRLGASRRGSVQIEDLVNHGLLFRDPPDHGRLRSLISETFSNRNLQSLRHRMAESADRLLSEIDQSETADLIESYAYPLPLLVIMELLGIEQEDSGYLRDYAAAMVKQTSADPTSAESSQQLLSFLRYLDDRFSRAGRGADTGLIDKLVHYSNDEGLLSREELFNMVILLIVAGFETVVNFIGNGSLALLLNESQRRLVMQNSVNAETVINELLRYDGPIKTSTLRWARRDLDVAGHRIGRGETIRLALGSANRDTRAYENPDRLDLTREGKRHLAFGGGIHYCIGAVLARLEGEVALFKLFERFPKMRLAVAQDQLSYRRSILIRGVEALPIQTR
jgi:cytochrome P450